MHKLPLRQLLLSSMCLLLLGSTAFAWSRPQTGWIDITPDGEGFSVKMPVKPEVNTQWPESLGGSYASRLYTGSDQPSGLLYMVVMQEFPGDVAALDPLARLNQFMVGFKQGLGESLGELVGGKFELTVDRDLKLSEHLGRQYNLTVRDYHGLVRGFDGGRRFYILLVLGGDEKNASVVRFFESFTIKPAPDPVPRATADPKTSDE